MTVSYVYPGKRSNARAFCLSIKPLWITASGLVLGMVNDPQIFRSGMRQRMTLLYLPDQSNRKGVPLGSHEMADKVFGLSRDPCDGASAIDSDQSSC